MAEVKKVELGKQAESFYDPTSGLQLSRNQVKELTKEHKKSKRVQKALRAGHIVLSNKPLKGPDFVEKTKDQEKEEPAQVQETNEELTHDDLMDMKKAELVAKALKVGSEYSEDELSKFNKSELADEILEVLASDEEE